MAIDEDFNSRKNVVEVQSFSLVQVQRCIFVFTFNFKKRQPFGTGFEFWYIILYFLVYIKTGT